MSMLGFEVFHFGRIKFGNREELKLNNQLSRHLFLQWNWFRN